MTQANEMNLGEGMTLVDSHGTGLAQIVRDEIDIQIATAKRYPRSSTLAIKEAETLACYSPEIAQSAYYRLPRGGKYIEGPSIRLAEMFANAWGNIRFGSRVLDINDRFVVAQGFAHDLQTNASRSAEVSRRITDKNGRRYGDDMIQTTAMAACAIAVRNALFSVIPRAYVLDVMNKAKKVAVGDAKSLKERRTTLLEYLTSKMAIDLEIILAVVKVAKADDIGLNEMEHLHGLATAVKEGMTSMDEAFPPLPNPDAPAPDKTSQPTKSRTDTLAEKIAVAPDKTPTAKPPASPPAPAPEKPVAAFKSTPIVIEPEGGTPEAPPAANDTADDSSDGGGTSTQQDSSQEPPDDPDMNEEEFVALCLRHRPASLEESAAIPLIRPRLNLWLPKKWSRLSLTVRKDYISKVKAGYFPWTM